MTISVSQMKEHVTNPNGTAVEALTFTVLFAASLHCVITLDLGGAATKVNTLVSSPVLSWSLKDAQNDAGSGERTEHWIADGASAGSITITATCDGNSPATALACNEIDVTSGYDSAAAAHISNQQATPGTGADGVTTTNTPALTFQPALISAFCMNSAGGSTPAAGTGFVDNGSFWAAFGGGTALGRSESKRVTSTAALTATFTAGSNVTHQSFAAVFLESAAAAPTQGGTKPLYVMP